MSEDDLHDYWKDLRPPRVDLPRDRLYKGRRFKNGSCNVSVYEGTKRAKPLQLYLDVRNHSPSGFEWSYSGSGPAQLALAILVDALGDKDRALRLHQKFKGAVIAGLPSVSWTLTHQQVLDAVRQLESKETEG